jgi:hypothetical protein
VEAIVFGFWLPYPVKNGRTCFFKGPGKAEVACTEGARINNRKKADWPATRQLNRSGSM